MSFAHTSNNFEDAKESKNSMWTCNVCTLDNNADDNICVVCETYRPPYDSHSQSVFNAAVTEAARAAAVAISSYNDAVTDLSNAAEAAFHDAMELYEAAQDVYIKGGDYVYDNLVIAARVANSELREADNELREINERIDARAREDFAAHEEYINDILVDIEDNDIDLMDDTEYIAVYDDSIELLARSNQDVLDALLSNR